MLMFLAYSVLSMTSFLEDIKKVFNMGYAFIITFAILVTVGLMNIFYI